MMVEEHIDEAVLTRLWYVSTWVQWIIVTVVGRLGSLSLSLAVGRIPL